MAMKTENLGFVSFERIEEYGERLVRVSNDDDGDYLFDLRGEWEDSQVRKVVLLIDSWYGRGLDHGRARKAREIRRALEID